MEYLESYKKMSFDELTDQDIKYLELEWVINWIWPENYWKTIRYIMTWLFRFIDYRRHDFDWFKWEDFHHSNRGLLKYSFLSIARDYKYICSLVWYKRIPQKLLHTITLPFKAWIIELAYSAVESDVGKRAYSKCQVIELLEF